MQRFSLNRALSTPPSVPGPFYDDVMFKVSGKFSMGFSRQYFLKNVDIYSVKHDIAPFPTPAPHFERVFYKE